MKILNKLLIGTAIGAMVFGALAFLFRNSDYDSFSKGDKLCGFAEYVNVDLLRLDVYVVPYDEDEIRVVYKNDLPLEIEYGDNSITISESERFVISLFSRETEDFGLWLYLPQRYYREVTVHTGQGSIVAGKTSCGFLTLNTESGDITCEGLMSDANLTTTRGFISLDVEQLSDNVSVVSRKGNAEIFLPESSSAAIDYETDTGECFCEITETKLSESGFFGINGGEKTLSVKVPKGKLDIKKRK